MCCHKCRKSKKHIGDMKSGLHFWLCPLVPGWPPDIPKLSFLISKPWRIVSTCTVIVRINYKLCEIMVKTVTHYTHVRCYWWHPGSGM